MDNLITWKELESIIKRIYRRKFDLVLSEDNVDFIDNQISKLKKKILDLRDRKRRLKDIERKQREYQSRRRQQERERKRSSCKCSK